MTFLAGLWTFFKSPVGLGVAAFAALMLFVQLQRNDAADGAAAECKADVYAAQLQDLKDKLAAAERTADDAKDRADKTDARLAMQEAENAKLKIDAAAAGNGGRIPPAIRKRVQDIR